MKEIKLTQSKVALVDDEDFERLSQWKWHTNDGYAARNTTLPNGKQKMISMHRFIMNTPKGMQTDHIDHNRLNNQKANLRICTQSQNHMNRKKYANRSSTFKGVSVRTDGKYKYYRAKISVGDKRIIKHFPFTPEGELAAARMYNTEARKHFKEYANLNPL